jgi:hypothetical protein
MTAAKVNLKEGTRNAGWFILEQLSLFFQAFVAYFGSCYQCSS